MAKGRSRFTPEHRFWDEDLVLREAPIEGDALLGDDVISMDEKGLVITRSTNILRGGALMGGLLMLLGIYLFGGLMVAELGKSLRPENLSVDDLLIDGCLLLLIICSMLPMAWWGIRLDCFMPRDTPIRFNRQTGKVQAIEFRWTWNPFGRWPLQHKEFDWSDVQAEVQRQAGTDGRSYVVRYALVLCVCKPGTFEVLDRITLKSNRMGSEDFPQMWNYVRRYMLEGPAKLPKRKLVPHGVSFRRSFFQYMRNCDPTQEGKDYRADRPWWLNLINAVIVLVAFWVIIPMGIFHYIAMRAAPEARWPEA